MAIGDASQAKIEQERMRHDLPTAEEPSSSAK
jgi:hypothetical protein